MSNNLVARLRELDAVNCMDSDHLHDGLLVDAADEIERLRAVVEAWLQYSQRAERDIETLRAERDEARRWCCLLWPSVCLGHQSAKEYAAVQGWDCFKEKP